MLKKGFFPSNFNWNIWNWNRLAVITLLFYKASHREQFLSGLTAKFLESKILGVTRTVERWVQSAVVFTVHVDALAKIDMRIAHRRHNLLLRVILDENEVILLVVRDCAVKHCPHRHMPRFTGQQLQVHVQMCIWEEVLEEAVAVSD